MLGKRAASVTAVSVSAPPIDVGQVGVLNCQVDLHVRTDVARLWALESGVQMGVETSIGLGKWRHHRRALNCRALGGVKHLAPVLAHPSSASASQFGPPGLIDPTGNYRPAGAVVLLDAFPSEFDVALAEVGGTAAIGALPTREGVARVAERLGHEPRGYGWANGRVTAVKVVGAVGKDCPAMRKV
jgi:hypothetical protein